MKNKLAKIGAAGALSVLPLTMPGQVVIKPPVYDSSNDIYRVPINITNDTGVEWQNLDLDTRIPQTLWNNPTFVDQSDYAGFSDYLTQNNFDYGISLLGVNTGWSSDTNLTSGLEEITNNSNIGGLPDIDYDRFSDGSTMFGSYAFPGDLLDTNNDGTQDYLLNLTSNFTAGQLSDPNSLTFAYDAQDPLVTAYTTGTESFDFSSDSLSIVPVNAVPEPKYFGLLAGLGALGAGAYRNVRRRKSKKE